MKFHPNEVQARSRGAAAVLFLTMVFLAGSFFRTQVFLHADYQLKAEENRLREVPLPAQRGIIRDRNGAVIAENVPGYEVSVLVARNDSLEAILNRVSSVIPMTAEQVAATMRRFRRNDSRPTVIFTSASFDIVSRLEEHRVQFPGLIIQETPKRFYPDGPAVAAFVGYTGEVREEQIKEPAFAGVKPGQEVGQAGIERQYDERLRGREGVRYVEVDARGHVLRDATTRDVQPPAAATPLVTNIDLDLQRFTAKIFGDSLVGAAVALDPATGDVLALHSAPSFDPNRFVGGIPAAYYSQLLNDPKRPMYNKATQGRYPPGSTWKLATAVTALELGLVKLDEQMKVPCTGGYQYGNRFYKCHLAKGHGSLTLAQAIEQSCDVYFYQLGLRLKLQQLIAGGAKLGASTRSGIDLPYDNRPDYPSDPIGDYFNRKYGPRGWAGDSPTPNLSIGQGENSQTVVNIAKFYTALATGGTAATPRIAKGDPVRTQVFSLDSATIAGLRNALAGVVARGTASTARIQGIVLAGKTGTAQSGRKIGSIELNHAWFAGFAPANDPRIVVAVMIEFGGHGPRAAAIASKIIEHYLKTSTVSFIKTEGD